MRSCEAGIRAHHANIVETLYPSSCPHNVVEEEEGHGRLGADRRRGPAGSFGAAAIGGRAIFPKTLRRRSGRGQSAWCRPGSGRGTNEEGEMISASEGDRSGVGHTFRNDNEDVFAGEHHHPNTNKIISIVGERATTMNLPKSTNDCQSRLGLAYNILASCP